MVLNKQKLFELTNKKQKKAQEHALPIIKNYLKG
jgi:hypothetical protein